MKQKRKSGLFYVAHKRFHNKTTIDNLEAKWRNPQPSVPTVLMPMKFVEDVNQVFNDFLGWQAAYEDLRKVSLTNQQK